MGDEQGVQKREVSQHEFQEFKDAIDRQMIEREYRAIPVWLNFANYFKLEGWNGPRFQAAFRAALWKLLSPGGVAVGGVLITSLATLYFAWRGNELLSEQNRLINVQNQLQESSRRAGLTVELTEVLNRVSDEAKSFQSTVPAPGDNITCDPKSFRKERGKLAPSFGKKPMELSGALVGRVVALSKSFRPYRYLDVNTDELARSRDSGLSPLSSPERAQLLLALASSNVSIEQVSAAGAEFGRAPMMNAQLAGLSLRSVAASQADWNGAILVHTDLSKADLRWSRLVEVNATCARFDGAQLNGADLSDGQFYGVSFRDADLEGANLSITKMAGADFSGANLKGAYTCDGTKPVYLDKKSLENLNEVGHKIFTDEKTRFSEKQDQNTQQPVCKN